MATGTNNITELPMSEDSKMWNFVGYTVLFFIMAGQALSAVNVLWGSLAYLVCNVLAIWRTFSLRRPMADKVRDVMCFGVTSTILITKFL